MNTPERPRHVITESATPLRSNQLPSHFRLLSPFFRESYLTSEYCMLPNQPKLGGIYVIPAAQDSNRWFGVLFVHHGYYQGGVFRFTIDFPDNFPDTGQVPVVKFTPRVFHPLINSHNGTFETKRFFRSGWIKGSNHVWQILKAIRASFYKIDTASPVEKQAADLYENHPQSFALRAKQEVEQSKVRLYDEPPVKDPHYIRFSKYDSSAHDTIRAKILGPFFDVHKPPVHSDDAAKKGLSFLEIR